MTRKRKTEEAFIGTVLADTYRVDGVLGVILALALVLAGCKEKAPPPRAARQAPVVKRAKKSSPPRYPAGRVPLEFPAVTTTARAGDFVLAIPGKLIAQAHGKGADRQSVLFYGGWMVKPGVAESRIKSRTGEEDVTPNAVIIPIRKGALARPGDVVLTAWASGFGMQRALVIRGGKSRKSPRVRYLDMKYENPAGLAREPDTLPPNTFHRLRESWEPGTSVAIRDEAGYRHGVVVAASEQKLLVIGFGRKLQVVRRADCVPLPVRPRFRRGAAVDVPHQGLFHPGVVKRVEDRIGRVFVTIHPPGGARTMGVGFGNVVRLLSPPDAGPGVH